MKKAIRLLTICTMAAALLAATAIYAAADEEPLKEQESPAETEAAAEPEASAEPADVQEPVDVPASMPAGTVYTVSSSGEDAAAARTVVDYAADGADSGLTLSGQSVYYYGAQITGADSGVVIDGAGNVYFGSSNGSIPLYGPRGAVSGIVWGGGQATSVDCGVGFLVNGVITGGVLVEDGASFTCREAVILCPTGSGSFRFHNARLSSESGILAQLGSEAGDVSVSLGNGSYSGMLINGGTGTLSVTIAHGALLFGDTAPDAGPIDVTVDAGGIWAVQASASLTSLTVEEGATVYGELVDNEDGTLTLLPSADVLDAGTYQSQPLSEQFPVDPAPATSAEEPPEPDAEQADTTAPDTAEEATAPGADAQSENKLFPLTPTPAPTASAEDVSEQPEPTPEAEIEPAGTEAEDVDTYEKHLFPLTPAATAPAEDPAESPAPKPEEDALPGNDATSAQEVPVSAEPDEDQFTVCRSLALGVGLASHVSLDSSVSAASPAVELAAQMARQTTMQPPTVSLLKTGVKTHSFLPETLDNQAIILYNPYCCSAA